MFIIAKKKIIGADNFKIVDFSVQTMCVRWTTTEFVNRQ